ncbi:thiamine pyrophosphate-binding protein [Erythrobacteraceae bacterium CFH 75059]|uniref:thiamine pyrophosphate-dependent enzyme n=1 Tax=Qipengyuania thermophila TaxID=2509361 RepID=UPI00102038E6|nr:thiamine pyrophosphate-dependent enzyme [Qipengyuania thermophila]TCD05036.1 thiamine pyrophosphate-binding protein [Erythrobacteraceae bacterium CFH 75059]
MPTAAEVLVEALVEQQCDRVFAVPGESFLHVLDALHDHPTLPLVTCRHESGAAFMAAADGALTGRPGVAFVTRGPGATNASIGVHVAFQDSCPLILFVGDVARPMRDREGFQEVDLPAFFRPLAKWAARIDDPERVPEYVARAYATAMSGRPGPVVLALPEDMLAQGCTARVRPCVYRPAQPPCPDAVGTMLQMLGDAAAPVALVGGAGWNAKARHYFQQFAERLGLPVATAFRRQDAIPASSPVYAGSLGYGPNPELVERVRAADVILCVGARLGEATTDGYSVPEPAAEGVQLIHVHPDPEELNSVYPAALAICADPAEFSESACLWVGEDLIGFDAGQEAHAQWRRWSMPPAPRHALDLARCVGLAGELLPPDTIVCNGAGNFAGWWHRFWKYEAWPGQLAPTCGAMGYGVPAAIAAALRHPERLVLAVSGDGDFLMTGQELATAVQHGASLIVIVVDNGSYGTIRMHQERSFPGRVIGTDLRNPDFAALARAFGCQGVAVRTTEEFRAELAEARGQSGVRLIHCQVDAEQLAASGATISGLRGES